jgi:hypothetical protein
MSFQVVPVGTLILSQNGTDEEIEIQSSDIAQGSWEKLSDSSFKGDMEQSVISFSANTGIGNVNWAVAISMDLSGGVIDSIECVNTPANLTIVQGISFEIQEV